MAQQQFKGELGVSRVVLRAADAEGRSVTRQRARINREQHQELISLQRIHQRATRNFQTYGDRLTRESLLQSTSPALDRLRSMHENAMLAFVATGDLQTNVVLLIG